MRIHEPTHDSLKAKVERYGFPGYGFCYRCGRPWAKVEGHTTWYRSYVGLPQSGCFPLCENCWTLLGCGEARIEYYRMLVEDWEAGGTDVSYEDRMAIMKAVANGG